MLMQAISPDEVQAPPRAVGRAALSVVADGAVTRLSGLRQEGSLKLLFPRRRTGAVEAVTLNTAGGVTGGDVFSLNAEVGAGASLTVSSQAAERIYRAAPGAAGRVETDLHVADGGRLNWLPQETILFDGAALERRLSLRLEGTARAVSCETLIFGRRAMGEVVRDLHFRDRLDLWQDGELLFADRLRLDGDAAATLARPAVAGGGAAVASVVCAAPGAASLVPDLRDIIGAEGGASALTEALVFLRLLAPDGFVLRQRLLPVLTRITGQDLPRTWMI